MNKDSILIISNDVEAGKRISGKTKLLRQCDVIKVVSYIEAISVLNSTQPALMIVYFSNKDSVNIIKEIRSIKSLDKVPIIFVMQEPHEDILMNAFNFGIDDYFFLSDLDSIILMRIFLSLQKRILYKRVDMCNEILISAGLVDKYTEIYKKEYAHIALRNFFSQSIAENMENTSFVYIKPVSRGGKGFNMLHIAEIVKTVPRADDIIAYARGGGFYLILYNSGIQGANSVFNRIKRKLIEECDVYAVAADITASFEEMEPVLYKALKDQIAKGEEFNYLYNLTFSEIAQKVDIRDDEGKRFTDFKQDFYGSFEKMVAPVFYQVQTKNTAIFPESVIDFSINETESRFSISQGDIKSELIITYPTYIKLLMDITHKEKSQQPVIRRLSFDFDDFSGEKLTSILDDIINEFSDRLNMQKMKEMTE